MDYQIVFRNECAIFILLLLIFANVHCAMAIVNRDLILTPKQGLQLSGKRIFYDETTAPDAALRNNQSDMVARPWEHTLKHVTYLTLFTNAANGIITGNFSKVKEYNDFLQSPYEHSQIPNDSRFGDIVTLAQGRLESTANGSYRFVEGNCDYECARENYMVAMWHVQKIRHRDVDRKFHYEMKFSVSPITSTTPSETVVRGGPNKRTIMDNSYFKSGHNSLQTFIQKEDDYPLSFSKILTGDDTDFALRRYDAARNFRQVTNQQHHSQVTPMPQSTFLRGVYRPPPPHMTHESPLPEHLNIGEYYKSSYGPKASSKIELFPNLLTMMFGKPQNYGATKTPPTYRPPTSYQIKFPRPEIYTPPQQQKLQLQQQSQPINRQHTVHHQQTLHHLPEYTKVPEYYHVQEQFASSKLPQTAVVAHHYHHHYFMTNASESGEQQVGVYNGDQQIANPVLKNVQVQETTPLPQYQQIYEESTLAQQLLQEQYQHEQQQQLEQQQQQKLQQHLQIQQLQYPQNQQRQHQQLQQPQIPQHLQQNQDQYHNEQQKQLEQQQQLQKHLQIQQLQYPQNEQRQHQKLQQLQQHQHLQHQLQLHHHQHLQQLQQQQLQHHQQQLQQQQPQQFPQESSSQPMPPAPQKFVFPTTQIEQHKVVHVTPVPTLRKPQYQQQLHYYQPPPPVALQYTTGRVPLIIYPAAVEESRTDLPTPRNKPFTHSQPLEEVTIRYSEPDPLYANANERDEDTIVYGSQKYQDDSEEHQLEMPQEYHHQIESATDTNVDNTNEHSESIEAQLQAPNPKANLNLPPKEDVPEHSTKAQLKHEQLEQKTSQSIVSISTEKTTDNTIATEASNTIAMTTTSKPKALSSRPKRVRVKVTKLVASTTSKPKVFSTKVTTEKQPISTTSTATTTATKSSKQFSSSTTESPLKAVSRYRNNANKRLSTSTTSTEKPVLKWKPRRKEASGKALSLKQIALEANDSAKKDDDNNQQTSIKKTTDITTLKSTIPTVITTEKDSEKITPIANDLTTPITTTLPTLQAPSSTQTPLLTSTPSGMELQYEVLTQKSVSKSVEFAMGDNGQEIPIIINEAVNEVKTN